MVAGSSSPSGRVLYYFPIIHTRADMGALGTRLQEIKTSQFGRQRLKHGIQYADQLWEQIENIIRHLPIPPGLRIYQDGLPVCGRESEIVFDLARAGSRNHQLLLWLQERGAKLMGTESPELLVEEYELAKAALLARPVVKRRPDTAAAELLEKRDRFIASRVNQTLQPGEAGILFLGMLHAVQPYLATDIRILQPIRDLK